MKKSRKKGVSEGVILSQFSKQKGVQFLSAETNSSGKGEGIVIIKDAVKEKNEGRRAESDLNLSTPKMSCWRGKRKS